MPDQEYRQDDLTDQGYCPICGERVTTVFVDGAGWCPDHGRVWCDWTRPVPPTLEEWDGDEGPTDPYRRTSVGDLWPTMTEGNDAA